MNSRTTWFWFGLAVGLFVFIYFFERHSQGPAVQPGSAEKLLAGFKPEAVETLAVKRGGQAVRLQREGDVWRLESPLVYPANPVVVTDLLGALAKLDRAARIDAAKLADFGLSEPAATVEIQQGQARYDVDFGAPTPAGDQVYLQLRGVAGVYTAPLALLDRVIPATANGWRSQALLTASTSLAFDRFEIRSATRGLGYTLSYNSTNRTWRLSKPMQARADRVKIEQLLLRALQARVHKFVEDNSQADAEAYGCQPPELELVLGAGTNDLLVVQFGLSPTNDPGFVYARRMSHTNVVLVRRDLVDALRVPFAELRDRHLFTFAPAVVQQIEAQGENPFVLRRMTNDTWRVVEPQEYPADAGLVKELKGDLYAWEVAGFERDVVTDFTTYGLAPAKREILLKTTVTNATGLTNLVLAQVAFGTNDAGAWFARRGDENSVYAINEADLIRLPQYGWQLRERRLWNFSLTNLVRITVRQGARQNQFIRNGTNDWSFGPASKGLMNEFAVEETAFRLTDLAAVYWMDRGEEARTRHGFSADGHRVELDVKDGEKMTTYMLEFGPERPAGRTPLACVTLDGQPWIFEFPWQLYQSLTRELALPKPAGQ